MRFILKEQVVVVIGYVSHQPLRFLIVTSAIGVRADVAVKLLSTLNAQQKEILEKFDDCYNELTDINEREIFAYAFKLGAKLMLSVMCEEETK